MVRVSGGVACERHESRARVESLVISVSACLLQTTRRLSANLPSTSRSTRTPDLAATPRIARRTTGSRVSSILSPERPAAPRSEPFVRVELPRRRRPTIRPSLDSRGAQRGFPMLRRAVSRLAASAARGAPGRTFSSSSVHATTVLCVRKDGEVVLMADGQVTLGSQVVKPNVTKVRRLQPGVIGASPAPPPTRSPCSSAWR